MLIKITERYTRNEAGFVGGYLLDPDLNPVSLASVNSALLTVYDIEHAAGPGSPDMSIINGRDGEEILGTQFFEMHATSGYFKVNLSSDDMQIVDSRRQVERHGVLLEVFYDIGSPSADGKIRQLFEIHVDNV